MAALDDVRNWLNEQSSGLELDRVLWSSLGSSWEPAGLTCLDNGLVGAELWHTVRSRGSIELRRQRRATDAR